MTDHTEFTSDASEGIRFNRFDDEAAARCFDFFHIRPNKCCDSIPLDWLIWSDTVKAEYCILDSRCLLMRDRLGDTYSGCIPYCPEEELTYYFRLQERYYNEVLHIPLRAFLQDREGVEYLRSAGLLENYEISEDPEIFDYIYSGDDLRTLPGRKYSKKRNHIHQFEKEYKDRWEYRSLGYGDRETVFEYLDGWHANRSAEVGGVDFGKEFTAAETLAVDIRGVRKLLGSPEIMKKVRVGGIFIDGALRAFSVGGFNPAENMAVIEIEKADPEITGLYQMINREFLIHEYPEAELVNREDDAGVPGLRQAKMSYNPVLLEKRYAILQK